MAGGEGKKKNGIGIGKLGTEKKRKRKKEKRKNCEISTGSSVSNFIGFLRSQVIILNITIRGCMAYM